MNTMLSRPTSLSQFSIYLVSLPSETWVVRTSNLPTGMLDGVPLGIVAVGGPLNVAEVQAIRQNPTDWPENHAADKAWFWQLICEGALTEHVHIGFE